MDKNKVKELIEKILALDTVETDQFNEVAEAIEYVDYYVRLGEKRKIFYEKIREFLGSYRNAVESGVPKEVAGFALANSFLDIIKDSFDREYFEACMKASNTTGDKSLLKEHIYKLDKEQLKIFLLALVAGKREKGLFLSAQSSARMSFELNQKSIAVDSSVMDMSELDYPQYCKANPLYMFKYLDAKTIAQVIYEHIDKNEEMAGELAKEIYIRARKEPIHGNSERYDKKMLREYLDKFSMEQLKDFFRLISYYRTERGFFISEDAWAKMMTGFNVVARKKNKDIPIWDNKNIFFKENETYFFDCLNKRRIADALYKYINDKVIMAENMAETLYHCGYEDAMQYPEMVLNLQMQF